MIEIRRTALLASLLAALCIGATPTAALAHQGGSVRAAPSVANNDVNTKGDDRYRGYDSPGASYDCGYSGPDYGRSGYGSHGCPSRYGPSDARLVARMSGDQMVARRGARGAYGTADLFIDPHARQLCFRLFYDRVPRAKGAQIRYGRSGENGGVAVLLHVGTNGDAGCVPGDPRVLEDIRNRPWAFYLRVDTPDYPSGAMRGQLEDPDYRFRY